MGEAKDVAEFTKSKGLTGAAKHGCAKVTQETCNAYGVKYIPHKVLLDKEGRVVKNFDMGKLGKELDELLAAGGKLQVPQEEEEEEEGDKKND